MPDARRAQEILEALGGIYERIDSCLHLDSLNSIEEELDQFFDDDNELINNDDVIGIMLDMILDALEHKSNQIDRFDAFMENQLAGLLAEEDEDEE